MTATASRRTVHTLAVAEVAATDLTLGQLRLLVDLATEADVPEDSVVRISRSPKHPALAGRRGIAIEVESPKRLRDEG